MSSKIKIILAEDEPALAQIIKESLETRNFEVLLCKNGEEAFEVFSKEKPELLVLDVMMPKKDGFTLAKEIRKLDKKIPIIFLTAKSQTQDVVEGFQLGGNDYLKKPFSMEELIVRVHSLLGRIQLEKNDDSIAIGNYIFNLTKQTLDYSGNIQFLTHREASLLHLLIENKNDILDRSLVLKKIWGDDDFFNGRSMDVFITKLRKKLSLDPNIQIINVRSQGYKLIA
ncbi:MAG: DNA-binding response regulator [Flavobacteriaceae bacterium]|jgi:DNA-binding response OmpR family regulator|uniref:response regulator transcription factor n=1 Tax=Flavobacterium sp. Leaf359 TaxID=1736351 RepID=UPI0006FCC568|nr:response regulator transcription factor [Flavobacterium sp. Leaf359]KQS46610.1 two-component system response regulator [Flavobacterium sp. Leaf359]PZO33364.1 MAG: DNA-binding response regulator [Flavobacteriaceae bacterium]